MILVPSAAIYLYWVFQTYILNHTGVEHMNVLRPDSTEAVYLICFLNAFFKLEVLWRLLKDVLSIISLFNNKIENILKGIVF